MKIKVIFGNMLRRFRTKTDEEIKEELGDRLCKYCPWKNGEIEKAPVSICEGLYCDIALENYKERSK